MILIHNQITLLTQIRIIQIPNLKLNVKLFNLFSVPEMQKMTQQFSIRGFEVDFSVRGANTQIPLRRKVQCIDQICYFMHQESTITPANKLPTCLRVG